MTEQSKQLQTLDKIARGGNFTSAQLFNQQLDRQVNEQMQEVEQKTNEFKEFVDMYRTVAATIDEQLTKQKGLISEISDVLQGPTHKLRWTRLAKTLHVPHANKWHYDILANSTNALSDMIIQQHRSLLISAGNVAEQNKKLIERRKDVRKRVDTTAQDAINYKQESLDLEGPVAEANATMNALKEQYETAKLDLAKTGTTEVETLRMNYQQADRMYNDLQEKLAAVDQKTLAAKQANEAAVVKSKQFDGLVKSMKTLYTGLEAQLNYLGPDVFDAAILMQATETGVNTIQLYNQVTKNMNQIMLLTTMGAKAIARATFETITKGIYDQATLELAEKGSQETINYILDQSAKLHEQAQGYINSYKAEVNAEVKNAEEQKPATSLPTVWK